MARAKGSLAVPLKTFTTRMIWLLKQKPTRWVVNSSGLYQRSAAVQADSAPLILRLPSPVRSNAGQGIGNSLSGGKYATEVRAGSTILAPAGAPKQRPCRPAMTWYSETRSMDSFTAQLDTFLGKKPTLGQRVYVAPGAVVLGDVTIGDYSSVWFNAVLRGDINRIVVGHHSNIQDNAVLHLADQFGCILGNYVTVGHLAMVHACTIDDEVLVGMGSIILDGAVVGAQSIIGARALVTQGMQIPPGSLVLGAPAKVVRQLTPEEQGHLKAMAEKYVKVADYYLSHRAAGLV